MERINPRSRTDRYGKRINREPLPLLANSLPYLSIMLGSLFPQFLISAEMPVLPPLGFMLLLGWRLMRPGLLPQWVGVPLGAFDDLFSGQPFGSAILLWSLAMIVVELVETRFPWLGFWQDWITAALTTALCIFLAMLFSGAPVTGPMLLVTFPQMLAAVILYPAIARLVSWLDRLRLMRIRVVA